MQDAKMEELARLAPRMAHHIRDELSVVETAADLLIRDKSISPEARDKVALIKDRLGYIAGYARQFLGITGNQASQMTVIDTRDLLSELARLLQRLLGEDNQLQMALDPNLWPIKGDGEQLENAFCILTANANDAMPSGGRLRIRATNIRKVECETEPEGTAITADHVLVEIADTGVGIQKDIMDRIFEPFFSTKGPGHGFGLAKVYDAIKRMSGHISVESEVGKGTVFSIFLPRYVPI